MLTLGLFSQISKFSYNFSQIFNYYIRGTTYINIMYIQTYLEIYANTCDSIKYHSTVSIMDYVNPSQMKENFVSMGYDEY